MVVADAVAQHVYDAARSNFAFQAGQELAAGGVVVVQGQGGCGFRLGCREKRR